jgi:hypothetical protein
MNDATRKARIIPAATIIPPIRRVMDKNACPAVEFWIILFINTNIEFGYKESVPKNIEFRT